MELCPELGGALQLAGDPIRVSEEYFKNLLNCAVDGLLKSKGNVLDSSDSYFELKDLDKSVLKQAWFGLSCLFVEACKNNLDDILFRSVLEDWKFSSERAAAVCTIYFEKRSQISAHLKSISFHVPHIVDVNWRLEYCIKSNHLRKVNQLTCLIELVTEKGNMENPETIKFSCTVEHLQDLVSKLKDAVKCWERSQSQVE